MLVNNTLVFTEANRKEFMKTLSASQKYTKKLRRNLLNLNLSIVSKVWPELAGAGRSWLELKKRIYIKRAYCSGQKLRPGSSQALAIGQPWHPPLRDLPGIDIDSLDSKTTCSFIKSTTAIRLEIKLYLFAAYPASQGYISDAPGTPKFLYILCILFGLTRYYHCLNCF